MRKFAAITASVILATVLMFSAVPVSAEDTATTAITQGVFAIELAKALGFAVTSDADAVALLTTKGIIPGDNWVIESEMSELLIKDVIEDVVAAGLSVAAVDTALQESGYTGTSFAELMQSMNLVAGADTDDGTAQFLRLPAGGQDLGSVATGTGAPPQQQRGGATPSVP